MLQKSIIDKIRQTESLRGKSILDIVRSEAFGRNAAAYIAAQVEERKAARASFAMMKKNGAPGKLPAHVIDEFILRGYTDVARFSQEFLRIVAKISSEPAALREYILQLGMQAYNLTIAQAVVEEYPELESSLFQKKTS